MILNVDDPNGSVIADILMPGYDWQQFRDQGQVPFARGLTSREAMQEVLDTLDPEEAERLREATDDRAAVVMMDHGVIKVYFEGPAKPVMGADWE